MFEIKFKSFHSFILTKTNLNEILILLNKIHEYNLINNGCE
jgi:hypothetical protein